MENQNLNTKADSTNEVVKSTSDSLENQAPTPDEKIDSKIADQSDPASVIKEKKTIIANKTVKPPKLEDKPFDEFINLHLIPGLKSSIQSKGILVINIELIEGIRPVVGGNCWMVFCEISDQRKFWLCFNDNIITSDKTILLSESNSDPSTVESFLIDEKKTTLPLLISRVLQRLNGQKWLGQN
tara:strand:- start:1545 stop:2096 length:552 start_codon:yes stop_codon:yes gene_type:complete